MLGRDYCPLWQWPSCLLIRRSSGRNGTLSGVPSSAPPVTSACASTSIHWHWKPPNRFWPWNWSRRCISTSVLCSALIDITNLPVFRFLANFYATEAFIFTNRLQEASNQLSLDPISDMTVTEFAAPGQGLPPSDWYPRNANSATLALLYNVAVVCILLGESAKAVEITKLVRACCFFWNQRPS